MTCIQYAAGVGELYRKYTDLDGIGEETKAAPAKVRRDKPQVEQHTDGGWHQAGQDQQAGLAIPAAVPIGEEGRQQKRQRRSDSRLHEIVGVLRQAALPDCRHQKER